MFLHGQTLNSLTGIQFHTHFGGIGPLPQQPGVTPASIPGGGPLGLGSLCRDMPSIEGLCSFVYYYGGWRGCLSNEFSLF